MARRRQGSTGRSRTQRHARTSRPIAGPAAFSDVAEPSHVLSQAATLLLIGAHLRGDTAAVEARAEASGRLLHPVARRRLQAIPPSDLSRLGFPRLPAGAPRLQPEALQRVAGMLLVQGGKRAEPLVAEAIRRREHLPIVLLIAADIGASSLEPELRRLTTDPDPEVARAAHDALEILTTGQS